MNEHNLTYRGVTFATELELRWAFLFDLLRYDWEYKPEEFTGGGCGNEEHHSRPIKYTPTFYLPKTWTWVHVENKDQNTDWADLAEFLDWGCPLTHFDDSEKEMPEEEIDKLDELGIDMSCIHRGLLVVSDIKFDDREEISIRPRLQKFTFVTHYKGLRRHDIYLMPHPHGFIKDSGCVKVWFQIPPSTKYEYMDGFSHTNKEVNEFFLCNNSKHLENPPINTLNYVTTVFRHAALNSLEDIIILGAEADEEEKRQCK